MKRREFLKSATAVTATATLMRSDPGIAATASETQNTSSPAPTYALGPDSQFQPKVPRGTVFKFSIDDPKYFPGTQRDIEVYVPAQYAGEKPACVWVSLDRLAGSLPAVFDNLIHKNEMPVTVAIGLHPGTVASADPPQNPRFNRSFEFDSLNDVLARFIVEEVLPAVERQKTPAGLPIRLSTDPNDRGVTGGSTGGIGSFTVAWQRPDAFRRIYSMIGTFVGMRGGDRYPVLVRKTEPKPLRIFLQDNDKDGWPGGLELGDWWLSNQEMERALTFAGYQVNHSWDKGGHDSRQGESILPDVLRWLWKDWPRPIDAGESSNFAVRAIAKSGENWELVENLVTRIADAVFDRPVCCYGGIGTVSGKLPPDVDAFHSPGYYTSPPILDSRSTAAAIASDSQGNIYVQHPWNGSIFRIDADGYAKRFVDVHSGDNGIAFGPDGRLYVAEIATAKIVAIGENGKPSVIAEGIPGHRLTITHEGNIYVTESTAGPEQTGSRSGRVWLIRSDGSKTVVADGLNGPAGISLTPDGLWLFVAESEGHHGYSYQVQGDGGLRYGEPFYWFHVPDSADDCGALQVCMDRQGWAYAATRMGIQVFDRNGRVTAIFPLPANAQAAGVCFGGADFQTLYVTTGNAIYRRNVKTTGMPSFAKPIVLPAWSAG